MRYHWLSALFFFTTASLAESVTPLVPWDDMCVGLTWHVVPINWESLGDPAANTVVDLYIALTHERENTFIDAVQEVGDPYASKVRLTTPRLAPLFTCGAAQEQVTSLSDHARVRWYLA